MTNTNTANISFRVDADEKRELEVIAEAMGMNLSTLFTIYVKKVLNERTIPFSLTAPKDPFYSESNMKRLEESIEQAKNGKVRTLTLEEFDAYGNS